MAWNGMASMVFSYQDCDREADSLGILYCAYFPQSYGLLRLRIWNIFLEILPFA